MVCFEQQQKVVLFVQKIFFIFTSIFRDYLRVLSGDIDNELGMDPDEDLTEG